MSDGGGSALIEKKEPTANVARVIATLQDLNGNKITQILASQNDFVIYEIETDDPCNRLKVLIDGHTEVSERRLIQRFDAVKQEYVKAKGMLYRSANLGTMKNRVGHALASCLSNDDPDFDGRALFQALCRDVENEQKRVITNRFLYLIPVVLSIFLWLVVCYALRDERITSTPDWQIASGFLAASLGTGVSLFTGAKSLHFEEFPLSRFYGLLGVERVLFGFIVGSVSYIAIKSGLISSSILHGSYWANLMVLVAAGFSEHFAPSIIRKVEA
ncbi:hypothetical protein [Lysobacter sp. HA18]